MDKIKFAKRGKISYEQDINRLLDISLNEKVQLIIEDIEIPCELIFNYNEKIKELNVKELKAQDRTLDFLDSMIFKEKDKGSKTCKTIKSFTKKFPNIVKMEIFSNENDKVFQFLKKLKVPNIVEKYLKIIKNRLYNLKIWSTEEEFKKINYKIYDYVTEKVYDKIYPLVPSSKDLTIYNNCLKLSWTEPKHYIKGKNNYIFDSFLPDVIYDFKQIHKQKSPRKKIIFMRDIFNCIYNVGKFNGENENNFGIDDQISILTYSFIKAQPHYIDTNCNYIELFIEKNGGDDNLLSQLKLICNFINEISYEKLNGVTYEEFNEKFKGDEKEEFKLEMAKSFNYSFTGFK